MQAKKLKNGQTLKKQQYSLQNSSKIKSNTTNQSFSGKVLSQTRNYSSLAIQNILFILKDSKQGEFALSRLIKKLKAYSVQLNETSLESLASAIHQYSKKESHSKLKELFDSQDNKSKTQSLIAHNQFKLLDYKKSLEEFKKIPEKTLKQFDHIIIGYCYKKLNEDKKALKHWDIAFKHKSSESIPKDNLLFIARELVLNQNFRSSKNIYLTLQKSPQVKLKSEALNALAFIHLQRTN